MASTTIADYQVLSDGGFTIDAKPGEIPDSFELSFLVPSDFLHDNGRRKPIIAFKVLPYEKSSFKIRMNENEIVSVPNLSQSHTRGFWEAFSATQAFPNGGVNANPTPVKFYISTGKVYISDVVVWYQIKR